MINASMYIPVAVTNSHYLSCIPYNYCIVGILYAEQEIPGSNPGKGISAYEVEMLKTWYLPQIIIFLLFPNSILKALHNQTDCR